MPTKYIRRFALAASLLVPLACGSDDSASQTADASSSGTAGTSSGTAGASSGSGGASSGSGGSSSGSGGESTGTGGSTGCPSDQIFCFQGCNGGGYCAKINECAMTNVFCPPKMDAAVDPKPSEAGVGAKCGATNCGSGQFCCGPQACGLCAPNGSGIFCGFTCDGG